jgi:hypothetical protein
MTAVSRAETSKCICSALMVTADKRMVLVGWEGTVGAPSPSAQLPLLLCQNGFRDT